MGLGGDGRLPRLVPAFCRVKIGQGSRTDGGVNAFSLSPLEAGEDHPGATATVPISKNRNSTVSVVAV